VKSMTIIRPAFFVLMLFFAGCGADISDRDRRQSDLRYANAYELWQNQHDILGAIRNLVRAVELNPGNADAYYLLGTIQLTRGEVTEAEKHLKEALRIRGKFPEALNSLAVLYIHQKRYDEAEKLLTEAVEDIMYREPWIARGNLGWCYIEQGRYEKAVEVLKRSVFDQPAFCLGYYRLGEAYYRLGKYPEAYEYLVQSVSIEQSGCANLQEAFRFLGLTALKLNLAGEAMKHFQKCVELGRKTEIGRKCAVESGNQSGVEIK